ncbi:hypothetical protein COCVIDRAFT_84881 [Bipolaris victoriae FI3]|uniref:C2H2-type domain-containing protein n=1 Tax=Bipolaris victoriae (strain FI3) TaxID=930091 RepID=W7F3C4_BIPV3|nr:hypothetical protein COCVIDRAFT_84881 [Bipolaris victoriae FI3]
MLPEFICNFLATLAHPPWTNAIRHNNNQLLRFNTLPAELQLRVLTLCSASTLFQLMRVSSGLRKEASKLFWAHPDAYFVIEAHWLLNGGYAGYNHKDLAFLAKAENIQVDYDFGVDDIICPSGDETVEVQQDQIARFWEIFEKRCPRARNVIINRTWTPLSNRKETHCIPKGAQLLVESSPPRVSASAFVAERANVAASIDASGLSTQKWQRAVYHLCPDGLWKKSKVRQDWKAVLIPPKKFLGPVGRFFEFQYRGSLLFLEQLGLWPIAVEALDRWHFEGSKDSPFACPVAGCDGYFQKAGEWTRHAAEFHNQDRIVDECMNLLPPGVQVELEDRRAKLAEKEAKIHQDANKIYEEWDIAGEKGQNKMKRMWQGQLSDDPAWETGAESWGSNQIWQELYREFWQEKDD